MFHRFERRQKLTAEEIATNAAARARRDALSMHCQCCGRKILANTGLIAHHGYERPSVGYQTGSCMGARFVPFEVSRSRLGDLIETLKDRREGTRRHLAALKAETTGIDVEFTIGHTTVRGRLEYTKRSLKVTRAKFAKAHAIIRECDLYRHGMRRNTFDELKADAIAKQEAVIKAISDHIDEATARYDGWKQTHKRLGDEWVAL